MPDISDLHDVFARLEQEIPMNYQSPVIADRISHLVGQGRPSAPGPRPWKVATTALLAAAAVIAVALAAVTISRHGSNKAPVGHQQSTGHSTAPTPAPTTAPNTSTSTHPSTQHSVPNSAATMPASRSALIAYVRGGALVTESDYEQSMPGTGQPMRPTPGIAEFNTPSGNISCAMLHDNNIPGTSVSCLAQQFSFHVPSKPVSCQMDWAPYFGFGTTEAVSVGGCVGGPEFDPTTMTLPYGSTILLSGIGCRSESGFLACADLTTGHGFAVNRDALKTY